MREEDLSPELEARIQAYCHQHLGAGEFSDEVREELQDHFRDRVLGYLNREDVLTEADAFLLAREHFGDPAAVRAMLLNAHVPDSLEGLYRRMAASAVVAVVTQPLAGLIVSPFIDANDVSAGNVAMVRNLLALVCTVLLIAPLVYWRTEIHVGAKPWFLRWPPQALVALLLAVYTGVMVQQIIAVSSEGPQPQGYVSMGVVGTAIYLVQAGVWFWWCRIPVRSPKIFFHAVLGLALYGWPLALMVMASTGKATPEGIFLTAAMFPLYVIQCLLIGLLYLGARWLVPIKGNSWRFEA